MRGPKMSYEFISEIFRVEIETEQEKDLGSNELKVQISQILGWEMIWVASLHPVLPYWEYRWSMSVIEIKHRRGRSKGKRQLSCRILRQPVHILLGFPPAITSLKILSPSSSFPKRFSRNPPSCATLSWETNSLKMHSNTPLSQGRQIVTHVQSTIWELTLHVRDKLWIGAWVWLKR